MLGSPLDGAVLVVDFSGFTESCKKNYIKDALESFLIYNFVADFRWHLLGGAVVLIRYDQESFKMEFIAWSPADIRYQVAIKALSAIFFVAYLLCLLFTDAIACGHCVKWLAVKNKLYIYIII